MDRRFEISRIATITTTIIPSTKSIEYTTFSKAPGAGVSFGVTDAVGVGVMVAVGDAVVRVGVGVGVGEGVVTAGVTEAGFCRFKTLNARFPCVSISS